MPYSFGKRSLRAREELMKPLQILVDNVILEYDFTILDAQRGRAEQEKAFKGGFSKAHFGDSAHNFEPAVAMDLAPYPIDFSQAGVPKFRALAKIVMFTANRLDIPVRWGGDWDMDGDWRDERFLDWGHFELHPWRMYAKQSQLITD